jgi:hypothetical protein
MGKNFARRKPGTETLCLVIAAENKGNFYRKFVVPACLNGTACPLSVKQVTSLSLLRTRRLRFDAPLERWTFSLSAKSNIAPGLAQLRAQPIPVDKGGWIVKLNIHHFDMLPVRLRDIRVGRWEI